MAAKKKEGIALRVPDTDDASAVGDQRVEASFIARYRRLGTERLPRRVHSAGRCAGMIAQVGCGRTLVKRKGRSSWTGMSLRRPSFGVTRWT